MKECEIKELIRASSMFTSFVNGQNSSIELSVYNVPIVIYKEMSGVSFFYQVPYDKKYDYDSIAGFMKIAIPVLSKMIEEERTNRLLK